MARPERISGLSLVARAFQPAGLRNFPVPCSTGSLGTGDWKVPRTRGQECLRYGDGRSALLVSLMPIFRTCAEAPIPRGGTASDRSQSFQNFLRVLLRLYVRPNLFDSSVRPDQESQAMRPEVFPSHEHFLSPNSVGLHDLLVLVGQQGEGEFEFPGKLVVGLHGIDADAENDRALFFELGVEIAERARLLGTAGRVILRIKIEHHGLALEVGQRNRPSAVGGCREGRSFVSFLEF